MLCITQCETIWEGTVIHGLEHLKLVLPSSVICQGAWLYPLRLAVHEDMRRRAVMHPTGLRVRDELLLDLDLDCQCCPLLHCIGGNGGMHSLHS